MHKHLSHDADNSQKEMTGVRRLLSGLILSAMKDLISGSNVSGRKKQLAREWFLNKEEEFTEQYISFISACDALDIEPERFIKAISPALMIPTNRLEELRAERWTKRMNYLVSSFATKEIVKTQRNSQESSSDLSDFEHEDDFLSQFRNAA